MKKLNDPTWKRTRQLLRQCVPPIISQQETISSIQFVSLRDFDACHFWNYALNEFTDACSTRFRGFPSCYIIKTPSFDPRPARRLNWHNSLLFLSPSTGNNGFLTNPLEITIGKRPYHSSLYRVSQEECARLREGVPYVKVYRYNQKHLCPNLNVYGDNGQRKVWFSGGSTHCTCQLTVLSMSVLECGVIRRQFSCKGGTVF